MRGYPIVEVRWIDSAGLAGWRRKIKTVTRRDVHCRTAGFLVHKDKKRLALALNVNDQGQLGELISIPRGAVKRIKTLRKG